MKIRWYKRAATQLHEVEGYVFEKFGEKARQEFMNNVERTVLTLAELPMLGKLDPLFAHRKRSYRSIIIRRLSKVVYYVKDDIIHIAAFWDTRREPKKQASQVE